MRIRGELSGAATVVGAGLNTASVFIGICSLPLASAGAPIANLPDPFIDATWSGWLFWDSVNFIGSNLTDFGLFPRKVVDNRSMRKLNDDEQLMMIGAYRGTATTAVTVQVPLRFLLQVSRG